MAVVLFGLAAAMAPRAGAVEVSITDGGTLVLTDTTGVNNRIGLSRSGSSVIIVDRAGITGPVPSGCTTEEYFTCSGISRIRASLGAGRDQWGPFGLGSPLPQEVDGGPGRDLFEGGPAGDRLSGGAGDDNIRGESGPDVLLGQGGNDRLAGGRDPDKLKCGKGKHDQGVGGPAPDVLSGCEDEQD